MAQRQITGDSYVIYITPPSGTFPWVRILRRRRGRQRGRVDLEEEISPHGFGSQEAFDSANIDETAHRIGRAILDDSEIIHNWKASRP